MPKQNHVEYCNSLRAPVFQTATYYFESTDEVVAYHTGQVTRGRYGRYDNPAWLRLERRLAGLDGAEGALVFPSGMSAITSTILAFCASGDEVVYLRNSYRNVGNLFETVLRKFSVLPRPIVLGDRGDFVQELERTVGPRTKIVLLEVPSNPHLYIADVEAASRIAARLGAKLVVDSTLATPFNFAPLGAGADLVVHSVGKYLAGHDDVVCGSVSGSNSDIQELRQIRNITGCISDPAAATVVDKYLDSFEIRMKTFNENGTHLAGWLENIPFVKRVFYPGLASHPHHELARKYFSGYGGVVSFELDGDGALTRAVVDNVKTAYLGTNFGGMRPMIEPVAVFTYFHQSPEERERIGIGDSLIRVSTGCGDVAELIADLDAAFGRVARSPASVGS